MNRRRQEPRSFVRDSWIVTIVRRRRRMKDRLRLFVFVFVFVWTPIRTHCITEEPKIPNSHCSHTVIGENQTGKQHNPTRKATQFGDPCSFQTQIARETVFTANKQSSTKSRAPKSLNLRRRERWTSCWGRCRFGGLRGGARLRLQELNFDGLTVVDLWLREVSGYTQTQNKYNHKRPG